MTTECISQVLRGAEAIALPLLPVPDGTGGALPHLGRLLIRAGGEQRGHYNFLTGDSG